MDNVLKNKKIHFKVETAPTQVKKLHRGTTVIPKVFLEAYVAPLQCSQRIFVPRLWKLQSDNPEKATVR